MEGHAQDPDAVEKELGARRMRTIIKYSIIIGLLLQFIGHPIESKIIGWDYCIEEGHPFWFYCFKFGWPIPGVIVNQIWGCLTTPNQWIEFSWPGLIGTTVFWITVFWILEFYWTLPGCFGEWEDECAAWPCSDKERCKKRTLRRR